MPSIAQRNANKKNSQRSTGPKTDEGKAASAQNAFRHGLSAAKVVMLQDENIQDFIELGNGLRAEHQPVTITEDALVTKMVESLWMSARASNLQQRLLLENSTDKQLFALCIRYGTAHDRALSRSLNDLIKLRKEARARENGFVSQRQKQEMHDVKIRSINTRTEAQQAVVDYRKVRNTRYFTAAPTQVNAQVAINRLNSSRSA